MTAVESQILGSQAASEETEVEEALDDAGVGGEAPEGLSKSQKKRAKKKASKAASSNSEAAVAGEEGATEATPSPAPDGEEEDEVAEGDAGW